jgi:hypothetical protein
VRRHAAQRLAGVEVVGELHAGFLLAAHHVDFSLLLPEILAQMADQLRVVSEALDQDLPRPRGRCPHPAPLTRRRTRPRGRRRDMRSVNGAPPAAPRPTRNRAFVRRFGDTADRVLEARLRVRRQDRGAQRR